MNHFKPACSQRYGSSLKTDIEQSSSSRKIQNKSFFALRSACKHLIHKKFFRIILLPRAARLSGFRHPR